MASRYSLRYLPVAVDDLVEIFDWIASDNPSSAAAFLKKLDRYIKALKTHPFMGHVPKDETLKNADYRILIVHTYLIFYIIRAKTIEIHRVIHGSRNLDDILFKTCKAAPEV